MILSTFASKMLDADDSLIFSFVSQHSTSDAITDGVNRWA